MNKSMEVLDQIIIKRPQNEPAVIQLLQGDLSALPKEHAVDILIISAYPGSYVPVERTLIAALDNKGLSVEELAKHKAFDLRDQLGCWLSQSLNDQQQAQFNFKKILCFEPWQQNTDQASVVGNIFRCINTFAFGENNNVIAMPVLASGKQKVPFEKMLPALLDACIFWMESGLPLTCIKLVLFSDEQANVALPVFAGAKQQNELKQSVRDGSITGIDAMKMLEVKKQHQIPGEESMQILTSEIKEIAQKEKNEINSGFVTAPVDMPKPPPAPAVSGQVITAPEIKNAQAIPSPVVSADKQYDYFVSYAHKHADIVDVFVNNLTAGNNKLQIFYDKSSIPPGGMWIKQISDAIQKAKKVLIFLSPDYSNSPVCWDEFQCAKLMEYNSKQQIIQTIYLYNDTSMPPIMGIYSWADCREGDEEKLQKMAAAFCGQLP
ncbi:MAG: toll/interleukin-1 receptor domain-containing protein [Bacteroidota bacterium]